MRGGGILSTKEEEAVDETCSRPSLSLGLTGMIIMIQEHPDDNAHRNSHSSFLALRPLRMEPSNHLEYSLKAPEDGQRFWTYVQARGGALRRPKRPSGRTRLSHEARSTMMDGSRRGGRCHLDFEGF